MRLLRTLYSRLLSPGLRLRLKRLQLRVAPRPMMSRRETGLIRGLLETGRFRSVLELGAGGSTLYFPRFLPADATWMSFEFDERWHNFLTPRLPHKARLSLVSSLADVAAHTATLEAPDLVLVDGGTDRRACIRFVAERCRDALVLLHDAGRPAYATAKQLFEREIVITQGYAPSPHPRHEAGGLSILVQRTGSA